MRGLRQVDNPIQRGSFTMIPVIFDTGSAAFHGLASTLWSGSFGR